MPSNICQYYEDLRNYALGYHCVLAVPLGMDLFIKRGMIAWINAWRDFNVEHTTLNKPHTMGINSSKISVPTAIQPEITMILANMILSCRGVL